MTVDARSIEDPRDRRLALRAEGLLATFNRADVLGAADVHVARRLGAMTRETDTRYLIVTHNAVTMSRMHRLFGVTMIEQGVSRLVSVDLGGAEELLAAE